MCNKRAVWACLDTKTGKISRGFVAGPHKGDSQQSPLDPTCVLLCQRTFVLWSFIIETQSWMHKQTSDEGLQDHLKYVNWLAIVWLNTNSMRNKFETGWFERINIQNDDTWRLLLSLKWKNVYLGCCCCLHFLILTFTGRVLEIHVYQYFYNTSKDGF